MNPVKYLRQIETLAEKIRQKELLAAELKARATSASGMRLKQDIVQTSIDGHKIEEMIIKYSELEAEAQELIFKYTTLRNKIISEIHDLSEARHIKILYARYVDLKSYEDISDEMDCSYDHVRRMHRYALNEFEKKHRNVLRKAG